MKRVRHFLPLAMLLAASTLHGEPKASGPNTDALVAKINSVVVLVFETDKPVRKVRATVDGKVVDSTGWKHNAKGIKIAVVRSGTEIAAHLQVQNMGGLLRFMFPMPVRANVLEAKVYGPGKQLELSDWTEVYSLKQKIGGEVIRSMTIEVK